MKSDSSNWNAKDFLAFLLIYASKADTQTSEAEVSWIREKCQTTNFEDILGFYNQQSDFQNIQTIQQFREQFYPGDEGKSQLEGFLREFFQADGRFSLLEQNVMRMLGKLL